MNDLLRRQTDQSAKLELAREAKEIRESAAFKAAHERARNDVINALASDAMLSTERKIDLVAELRAVDRIAQALKSLADDLSMARRHG